MLGGVGVVADVADDEEIVEFAAVDVLAVLADEETEMLTPRGRVDLVLRLPVTQIAAHFDCSAAVYAACADYGVAAFGDYFADLGQVRDGFQAGHLDPCSVDCRGGDNR